MAGNDPLRQLRKLVSALAAADPASSVGQEAVESLVATGENFCAADHAPEEAHGVWEVALSLWCALPAASTGAAAVQRTQARLRARRSARIRFLNGGLERSRHACACSRF
jgi:hypothetical protein